VEGGRPVESEEGEDELGLNDEGDGSREERERGAEARALDADADALVGRLLERLPEREGEERKVLAGPEAVPDGRERCAQERWGEWGQGAWAER
jgi:hypothetical protein